MTANLIVLVCWTAISPLVYVRTYLPGTDDWNRVLATYGTCRTSGDASSVPYIAVLVTINVIVLIITNVQSFQARNMPTDFQESKYIGLADAFVLQAAIIGVPVAAMSTDDPRVMYMILTTVIGVCCLALLGFIFVPKIKSKYDFEKNGRGSSQTGSQPGSSKSQFLSGRSVQVSGLDYGPSRAEPSDQSLGNTKGDTSNSKPKDPDPSTSTPSQPSSEFTSRP